MKIKRLLISLGIIGLFVLSFSNRYVSLNATTIDSHSDKEYYRPTNIKSAGGWESLMVSETENGTHIFFKDANYVTIRTASSNHFNADGIHMSVENYEGDGICIAFSNLQSPDAYEKALRFYAFNKSDYTGVMRYSCPTWSELAVHSELATRPIPAKFEMSLVRKNENKWAFVFNNQEFEISQEQFASAINDENKVYVSFSGYGGSKTIDTYSFDLTAIHDSSSKCAKDLTDTEIELLDNVNRKILAIGDVDGSNESKAKIDEANNLYNQLDEKMQKMVVNRNLLTYANQNYYVYNNPLTFDENNILTRMFVMSDNHLDTNDCTNYADGSPQDRFEHGLEYASKIGADSVLLAGDMTDWVRFDKTSDLSTANYQMNHFVESLNKSLADNIELVYCYGNHDSSMDGSQDRSEMFIEKVPDKYFRTDINKDEPLWREGFRHCKIDGFDYLAMEFDYTDENQAFTQEALDWMENKLEQITTDPSYDNRPIFILQHCPFSNTCYGSGSRSETPSKLALYDIYKKYPQIVLLCGHSHYPLNYQTYVYQSDFTTIATAATSYLDMDGIGFLTEGGYKPTGSFLVPYKHTTAQGLIIEVDKDYNMRVKRVDINKEKQILNEDIVPAPDLENKTNLNYYTDGRKYRYDAPEFKQSAELYVDTINNHTTRVSFSTAQSESIVQYYKIIFEDEDGIHQFNSYANNWIYPQVSDMPLSKTVDIDTYFAKKPYTVSVIAVDSFEVESKPLTKIVVDNPEKDRQDAQNVINQIDAITNITADSKAQIYSAYEAYCALSYDAKQYVTNYSKLELAMDTVDELYTTIEQYYNNAKTGKTMVGQNYWATTGEMKLQNTDKGIMITYEHAMANVRMGIKQFDLDGLHLTFDSLHKSSEMEDDLYPAIGILLGGSEHPIYTEPEKTSILLFLDTSVGKLEGHPGFKQIINDSALKYENLKDKKWDIKFQALDNGDFLVEVAGVTGVIDKSYFDGSFTLKDPSKAYLSISCWIEDGSFTLRLMSAHDKKSTCYEEKEISFEQIDKIKALDKEIALIGTVSKNSKAAIESCEEKYNQIPDDFKFMLTNAELLANIRQQFDELPDEPEQSSETHSEQISEENSGNQEDNSKQGETKKKGCKSTTEPLSLSLLVLLSVIIFKKKKHIL